MSSDLVEVDDLKVHYPIKQGLLVDRVVGTSTRSTGCRCASAGARRTGWSASPAAASPRWGGHCCG